MSATFINDPTVNDNKCHVLNKDMQRCSRKVNLMDKDRDHSFGKNSCQGYKFKVGESLYLKDQNMISRPVCSQHFNIYYDR
jgi:hypothetical protein